jgi:hypothetical protein
MKKGWIALTTAAWLMLIGAGIAVLDAYSNKFGTVGDIPMEWPADLELRRAKDQPTLILIAHPRCPCTRAALGEIDALLAQKRTPLQVHVIFALPPGVKEDWGDTDLWRTASRLRGVEVHRDPGGTIARRLGAQTSGQVLLYDPEGDLVFRGGITVARGHAGDNPGRTAILESLASGHSGAPIRTPVFGCSISAPETLTDCAACRE